jgi:hypothetical protein
MTEVVLKVVPAAHGWWLDCDLPLEPTFFLSGDLAEQTARALALRLAECGRNVQLFVKDRLDQTVSSHQYFSL